MSETPHAADTVALRVMVMLADRAADDLSTWLSRVAIGDPERACELYLQLLNIVNPHSQGNVATAAEFTGTEEQQIALSAIVRAALGLAGHPAVDAAPWANLDMGRKQ